MRGWRVKKLMKAAPAGTRTKKPRRKMGRKAGIRMRMKKPRRMTIPWKPAKPMKMKMKPTHKTASNSPQETAGCFHIDSIPLRERGDVH